MTPLRLLFLCLAVSVAACGGNAPDNSSGAATAASSASSSSGTVKAVPHEKLEALFPAIPGFKREAEPAGETDAETNVTRVRANYVQDSGGTGGLSVEMMDIASNAAMLTPLRESLKTQGTHKSDLGTQKTTTIAGFPGFEEWTTEAGNGVVTVLVSDRFVVTLTGSTVGKVDVIYKAFESIDLKKIAALK